MITAEITYLIVGTKEKKIWENALRSKRRGFDNVRMKVEQPATSSWLLGILSHTILQGENP